MSNANMLVVALAMETIRPIPTNPQVSIQQELWHGFLQVLLEMDVMPLHRRERRIASLHTAFIGYVFSLRCTIFEILRRLRC